MHTLFGQMAANLEQSAPTLFSFSLEREAIHKTQLLIESGHSLLIRFDITEDLSLSSSEFLIFFFFLVNNLVLLGDLLLFVGNDL